jgi:hypothetical protein
MPIGAMLTLILGLLAGACGTLPLGSSANHTLKNDTSDGGSSGGGGGGSY